MKAFLAYKYSDFNTNEFTVDRLKNVLTFFNPDFELISLEKKKIDWFAWGWKYRAASQIKKSSLVFYIEGKEYSNNVFWELKRASNSHKKIVRINLATEKKLLPIYEKVIDMLKSDPNFIGSEAYVNFFSIQIIHPTVVEAINTYFEQFDVTEIITTTNFREPILCALEKIEVHNQTLKIPNHKKLSEVKDIQDDNIYSFQSNLQRQKERKFDLFNLELSKLEESEKAEVLLEQYKIFIQSSETLMARRQSVNSFYLTINTALIAIFAALVSLKIMIDYVIGIGVILCVIGMVTSIAWQTMLTSYGVLNKSKIKVISLMEAQLPAALFDAEWHVMTNVSMEETYKPFTKTESSTARTFFWLYLIMFAVSLLYSLGVYIPKIYKFLNSLWIFIS